MEVFRIMEVFITGILHTFGNCRMYWDCQLGILYGFGYDISNIIEIYSIYSIY